MAKISADEYFLGVGNEYHKKGYYVHNIHNIKAALYQKHCMQ